MADFKINVSDRKTGKTYKKEVSSADGKSLIGKRIGDVIKGEIIGLPSGYEVSIQGGSDSSGFPMRRDLEGTLRKKLLLTRSVGNQASRKGMRVRKTIAANTITENTVQINTVITKAGAEPLEKEQEATKEEASE